MKPSSYRRNQHNGIRHRKPGVEKAQCEQRRQANTQRNDEKKSEARRDEPPNKEMGGSEIRLGFCNDDRNEKQTLSVLRKNIMKHHETTCNQHAFLRSNSRMISNLDNGIDTYASSKGNAENRWPPQERGKHGCPMSGDGLRGWIYFRKKIDRDHMKRFNKRSDSQKIEKSQKPRAITTGSVSSKPLRAAPREQY